MTVEELKRRMSSREVAGWIAVFMTEAEEMEAARTGRPSPSARTPSDAQQTAALLAWRASRPR